MPRKGYASVTVSEEIYEKAKRKMKEENEKAGFRRFRSVSHFVEYAIMNLKGGRRNE